MGLGKPVVPIPWKRWAQRQRISTPLIRRMELMHGIQRPLDVELGAQVRDDLSDRGWEQLSCGAQERGQASTNRDESHGQATGDPASSGRTLRRARGRHGAGFNIFFRLLVIITVVGALL